MDKPALMVGCRVRIKRVWIRSVGYHGGETGVVVAMPGQHVGPSFLFAVQIDGDGDKKCRAIAADWLEPFEPEPDQDSGSISAIPPSSAK